MTDITDPSRDWSAVAAAWDAEVDEVDEHSFEATEAMLDRLAVEPGDRVLELAAGPGSLAATWSALVGPTGTVLISDLAEGMVRAAADRSAGLDNVSVTLLDASAIDRPDDSFDVVACRMGLMFTPDPSVAFAEIHRALVPGGRVGVLTWAGIEHNPWMTCVGMAAMMNGLVHSGPPVGPGGIFSLGDPDVLEGLAVGAAFDDVKVEAFPVTFRADDVDDHVERVSALAGPLAAAFEAASPEQLAAVRRTAADLAGEYVTTDGVALPGRALLLSGRA